jgi:hypothetical protein
MKLSEMNEEQRNRTLAHRYLAFQLINSNNGVTSHPKKEDNNNITSTDTPVAGHKNSPVAVSPHMKMNDKRGDKMTSIKAEERVIIPHTKITARFNNDITDISKMTNQTTTRVNMKPSFPVTPQKILIKKNSTVEITPDKQSKCVKKENCVPSK